MDDNYLSETEISPKEIIKYMKTNIYNNHFKNSYQYISSDYILNRASLFSLIRKISNKMGFKSQTYFLSIYYLDILFSKNKKIECNYKTLGLACLLLSAKYIENDPYVPNLSSFIKVYNIVVGYKYIISVTDLFYAEVLTCKMLGYKLNYYTIYDFDSFFFGHGIIKMEQIRDLNNGNLAKNKNNYETSTFNSVAIRQILEKIYRKSRHYLELIISNSKICLKYSSLVISIYIMKKSIEEILYEEQRINQHDLIRRENFVNKTSKYFKEIMNEIYDINYESIDSFAELISDTELIKLLQEEKKGELSPALVDLKNKNNIKLSSYSKKGTISSNGKNNKNEKDPNSHTISSYGHIKNLYNLNSLSSKYKIPNNNNFLLDSMNIYLNKNDNFYKTFISQSSSSVHQLSSQSKEKEKESCGHKQSDIISNNLDTSNPSSSKELNQLEYKRKKYQNQRANRAFTRHSELNCVRHLQQLSTYNDLSSLGTRTNESNNASKKNLKDTSRFSREELDEKYNDSIENKTATVKNEEIKFESPRRFDKYEGYNYDKYKKLKELRGKVFRDINIKNRHNSGHLIDSSNTINTVNTINTIGATYIFGDQNNSKNYMKIPKYEIKPYSKKVIRNASNNSKNPKKVFPVKKKTISCFSTSNNFGKAKLYNSLMMNTFSSDLKTDEKEQKGNLEQNKNNLNDEDINDNNMADNDKDKLDINDNKGQKQILSSKNFNQKSNYFNMRKNMFVNIIEDEDGKDKKNEEKIYIKEEFDNNEKDGKEKDEKEKGKENEDNKVSSINGYSSIATSYYNRKERQKQLIDRITKANYKTLGKTNDDDNNNIDNANKKDINNEIIDKNINKTDENINSENKNNDENNNRKKYKRRLPRNEPKNELIKINSYMDSKPNVFMRKKFFVSSKNRNKNESSDIKKENNNNNINNSKEVKSNENKVNKDESKTKANINPNALTSKNANSRNDNKCNSIRYRYINSKKKVFENTTNKEADEVDKNNNKDIEDSKKDTKDENKLDKKNIKEDKNKEEDKYKDKDKDEEKEEILENKHHKTKTELKEVKRNFNDRIRNYIKNDEKNNLSKTKMPIKINKKDQSSLLSKTAHPTSSIFKLLSKTKNLTNNNIQLSKEELDLEIPNGYNFLRNRKYNRINKTIKTIEQSDSKDKDKNKGKNNTTIENKEILLKDDRLYNTISTDNNTNNQNKNNNKNDNRVIRTYQYRNLLKNKLSRNIIDESSNSKLNINTNNGTNTIVINNNININFNNKMEPTTGRFITNPNKYLKRNETEANKIGNYFEKINPNRRNNNKMSWKNYYSGGTIDCINVNKSNFTNQNNSISSLLHRLPFYKKTLENNRKILSGDLSME